MPSGRPCSARWTCRPIASATRASRRRGETGSIRRNASTMNRMASTCTSTLLRNAERSKLSVLAGDSSSRRYSSRPGPNRAVRRMPGGQRGREGERREGQGEWHEAGRLGQQHEADDARRQCRRRQAEPHGHTRGRRVRLHPEQSGEGGLLHQQEGGARPSGIDAEHASERDRDDRPHGAQPGPDHVVMDRQADPGGRAVAVLKRPQAVPGQRVLPQQLLGAFQQRGRGQVRRQQSGDGVSWGVSWSWPR